MTSTAGRQAPVEELAPRPASFALLAETILVGLVVGVLALGVVTALPALAAGAAHLRRHAAWRADPMRMLLTDFRGNLRGVWGYALALPALLVLLGLNLDIATATALPGGPALRWLMVAVGGAVVVLAIRAAAARGLDPVARSWPVAVRRGRERALADPVGSLLLATAVAVCGVIVWMLPILVVLAPGLLVLAMVGVENRYQRDGRAGAPRAGR